MGQPTSTVSLDEMISQRQVLLCNFAKGHIGEANAKLLGALITTEIFLTALARQTLPEHERVDHYLYLDECQNISTTVLGSILSESAASGAVLGICKAGCEWYDKPAVFRPDAAASPTGAP